MMSAGIRIIGEFASCFGITLCCKCGTRTKMKHTKQIHRDSFEIAISEGYTICPKCGSKEKWMDGQLGGGTGF